MIVKVQVCTILAEDSWDFYMVFVVFNLLGNFAGIFFQSVVSLQKVFPNIMKILTVSEHNVARDSFIGNYIVDVPHVIIVLA